MSLRQRDAYQDEDKAEIRNGASYWARPIRRAQPPAHARFSPRQPFMPGLWSPGSRGKSDERVRCCFACRRKRTFRSGVETVTGPRLAVIGKEAAVEKFLVPPASGRPCTASGQTSRQQRPRSRRTLPAWPAPTVHGAALACDRVLDRARDGTRSPGDRQNSECGDQSRAPHDAARHERSKPDGDPLEAANLTQQLRFRPGKLPNAGDAPRRELRSTVRHCVARDG